MTRDSRRPDEAANDEIASSLRSLLAPPGGDAYWDGLHARVMATVAARGGDLGPWSVLAAWTRPAVIAAAAALLVCTAAVLHSRQAEARVAYESLMAAPPGAAPVETAIRPAFVGDRDVTLGFVIAHQEDR